jgi:two-component system OmpR family response regulator
MIKLKILIIDDEIDYCTIMKGYFQSKNYEVSLAFTLKQGLETLERIKPDILFLDNNLPDGQGWECIDEIVARMPSLKIYLVSAYRQKADYTNPPPNVTVWEKPISITQLNSTFQEN